MARYALLVGCDEYQDSAFSKLNYPRKDVARLKAIFDDPQLGYFDETSALINGAAETVRRSLERFARQAQKGDLLLLYFSGHGKLDRSGKLALIMATTDGQYLMSTALGSDEIKRYFNNSNASQKVIILDCCHSGAFETEGFKGAAADAMLSAVADEDEGGSGNHVLTACTKFEIAKEHESLEAGVLTDAIIKGIEGAIPSHDASGDITLADVVKYLGEAMRRGEGQTPQYSACQATGSVVLSKRRRVFDLDWEMAARRALDKLKKTATLDEDTMREAWASLNDPSRRIDWALIDDLVAKRVSASQFVRRWVLRLAEGEKRAAALELETLRAKLDGLEQTVAAHKAHAADIAEAERWAVAVSSELDAAKKDLQRIRAERDALKLAQSKAELELVAAKETADRIRAERALAQNKAAAAETALASEKSRSERRKREREEAKAKLALAEAAASGGR